MISYAGRKTRPDLNGWPHGTPPRCELECIETGHFLGPGPPSLSLGPAAVDAVHEEDSGYEDPRWFESRSGSESGDEDEDAKESENITKGVSKLVKVDAEEEVIESDESDDAKVVHFGIDVSMLSGERVALACRWQEGVLGVKGAKREVREWDFEGVYHEVGREGWRCEPFSTFEGRTPAAAFNDASNSERHHLKLEGGRWGPVHLAAESYFERFSLERVHVGAMVARGLERVLKRPVLEQFVRVVEELEDVEDGEGEMEQGAGRGSGLKAESGKEADAQGESDESDSEPSAETARGRVRQGVRGVHGRTVGLLPNIFRVEDNLVIRSGVFLHSAGELPLVKQNPTTNRLELLPPNRKGEGSGLWTV